MSPVAELEARLQHEPNNLALKVTLAEALCAAGRPDDACALYREIGIAGRALGPRTQAIAACHRMLELVPEAGDARALLAELEALEAREQAWWTEPTPLPAPLPYHLDDSPVSPIPPVLPVPGVLDEVPPAAEGVATYPGPGTPPELAAGLAGSEPDRISLPLPPIAIERLSLDDDAPTPFSGQNPPRGLREGVPPLDDDDDAELTLPREFPLESSEPPLDVVNRFLEPLPADARPGVLGRCQRRTVPAGTIVIRQGESNHPLVIVTRGRLEVRVHRVSGPIVIGTIAPGEYVGEAALLASAPAPANVIAIGEVELLLLAARDFYEVAAAHPDLWAELKAVAERRTRQHDRRIGRV